MAAEPEPHAPPEPTAPPTTPATPATPDGELGELRERLARLEDELAAQSARANAAIAAAQDRAYWLDRWHLDLNAVMARPIAGRVRAVLRALRVPYRMAIQIRRSLRRG